ncbi:MAG: UvrD-helicase domain-containing protein [Deltaproteobacteria bacterium]|nr:UvrD-helicase domain-containing protein [Deltaproteobacteria bacterium]MBN2672246.1 UvrD-helicase domain-containing protein [Deltaproteobacteria bacterium]
MATSKELDFVALYRSALEKGIGLIGTGDFTHPGWMAEIEAQLIPAEDGLFRLKPELEKVVNTQVPASCVRDVRFVLQVEISNIYKKDDRTRKNHNLVYVPSIDAAKNVAAALEKIGNIKSDGRPILGLDARDLLEITLESHPLSFLIPAHIWTPWFSMLGSKSGFDSLEECFGDLSKHIFAVETGLSSDPAMNWRLSALDHLTLVSNSDAHSPGKLGREANLLDIEWGFEPLLKALRDKEGYVGTLEFYPDEGKYHLDGHRKCNVRLSPQETIANDGKCPVCGKPVTIGVMNRVAELADRPEGATPDCAFEYASIVPFNEIVAETLRVSPGTKKVEGMVRHLRAELGPELYILRDAPLEEIEKVSNAALREGVRRVRTGELVIDGGYDGEFGTIRIFEEGELSKLSGQMGLAGMPRLSPQKKKKTVKEKKKSLKDADLHGDLLGLLDASKKKARQKEIKKVVDDPLFGLDEQQRAAARRVDGPLLVVAGPGTGKTRTLTARIAHQVKSGHVPAKQVLAISFTNQAALELEERLRQILPADHGQLKVRTFHSFGKDLLEEFSTDSGFRVIEEDERIALMQAVMGESATTKEVEKQLAEISLAKQGTRPREHFQHDDDAALFDRYEQQLRDQKCWDIDDLVLRAYTMLRDDSEMAAFVSGRFTSVSVDEYQDVNDVQAALVRLLCPDGKTLMVIGDPDQSIYGFRGARPGHFARFEELFPGTVRVELSNTYRLSDKVLGAARSVIAPFGVLESKKAGVKVEVVACPTAAAEAEQIVVRLEKLIGGTSHFALDSGRGGAQMEGEFGFGDVAILVRTKMQRKEILEALERSGIPALAVGEEEPHDERAQKVAVMTMHASKGREFEVVFVAGVEPQFLPFSLPGKQSDAMEERRLLYVAVTRAKTLCILSYANKRTVFGKTEPAGPSVFLSDLPADAVSYIQPEMPKQKKSAAQLSLL